MKVRAAYGQSGRAPSAFDAVRTWQNAPLQGNAAFVPRNVGNPDLGPEVTSETEGGIDAAWLDDRLTSTVTYYRQITKDALFNVAQTPSVGFGGQQRLNVGKTLNEGWEIALNGSPVRGRDWGWDLGVNFSTNRSEVLDMGGVAPFTIGSGGMQGTIGAWIIEGEPIGVWRDRVVSNPEEIAAPTYEQDVLIGPSQPTLTIGGNTTVHLPFGIAVSARGEYRTGHWYQEDYFSVARAVRSPLCYPYYEYPEGIIDAGPPLRTSIALKADTPALWRARCSPALINGAYWWDLTYFRLRNLTATIPMDFALPDRFTGAVLTVGWENPWLWRKHLPFGDPEAGNNTRRDAAAAPTDGMGIGNHRLPVPAAVRVALRVTF
jgi:hypothetical protein